MISKLINWLSQLKIILCRRHKWEFYGEYTVRGKYDELILKEKIFECAYCLKTQIITIERQERVGKEELIKKHNQQNNLNQKENNNGN